MRSILSTSVSNPLSLIRERRFRHLVSRFFLVGAGCALSYILVATILVNLGVTAWLASGVTYLAFIPVAYILQRNYAFQSSVNHQQAFPRYLLIQVLGELLSLVVPYYLAHFDAIPTAVVFGVVSISVAGLSFILMHFWTFKASFPDKIRKKT
jgi:putative flippase GtrA